MTLYRAISNAENIDFRKDYQFRTARNTLEGKQFFKSEAAVREFASEALKRNYQPPYTSFLIINVDDDCIADISAYTQELDGFEAITISEDHLPPSINVLTSKNNMNSKTTYDLKVKISLLPTEMGGRKKPVFTGYKPSFSFNSIQHFSGEIHLVRKKVLNPGDSGTAVIKLLPARNIRKNLKPNDAFTITEGNKTIGSGIIEKVTVIE